MLPSFLNPFRISVNQCLYVTEFFLLVRIKMIVNIDTKWFNLAFY